MKRQYRMPDGSITTDVNAYGKAWTEPGEIVANALGMRLGGMDPGYLFHGIDWKGSSGSLPTYAVLKLAKYLESVGEIPWDSSGVATNTEEMVRSYKRKKNVKAKNQAKRGRP